MGEAPYEVTKEFEEWEVRRYPATKWISTDARDVMPHDGPESSLAFYRLFHYIDGSNNLNTKIPMTAPVTMKIIPGEGPNGESNFTMSFYIPSDMQEDPPLPTEDRVYIEEREEFMVVSRKFGGFPNDLDFSGEAAMLYSLASEEGFIVNDGPYVIFNRRNEVFLEI